MRWNTEKILSLKAQSGRPAEYARLGQAYRRGGAEAEHGLSGRSGGCGLVFGTDAAISASCSVKAWGIAPALPGGAARRPHTVLPVRC